MRVERTIEIAAPRERVWQFVADPACYPAFMAGVTRWEPAADDDDFDVGSRYVARLRIGAAPLGAVVELVEVDPPGDLAWTSITGIDHRGRWRLREVTPKRTSVSLRLAYQAPGGLLATVADRVSAPMVRANIDETLQALKDRVEGTRSKRPSRPAPLDAVRQGIEAVRVLAGTGALRPGPPRRILGAMDAFRRWGTNPAVGVVAAAARYPEATAIVDDRGSLTYAELDARTNALANALADQKVGAGTTVGILARNHRGFVEAAVAGFKVGADVVFLNTGFSAAQAGDVVESEGIDLVIHDDEFAAVVRDAGVPTIRAWVDHDRGRGDGRRPATRSGPRPPILDELAAEFADAPPPPPVRPGRTVILTSGTTGRPKGAARGSPSSAGPGVALLSRIPYRVRDTTVIAPPLFHAWGLGNMGLALAMGSTMVLRRRFDAATFLADIEAHRARVAVVVPVMLQRVLDLDDDERTGFDTSSLEVVAASGSAVSGALAARFMDEFGDVLYNLYGSTEVAFATIAGPEQLRAAPGTAGTPPTGTRVAILDDQGLELPRGRRGRIFVGNDMTVSGYTSGSGKTVIRGLVDSGDTGYFDPGGRLFVEGRSDDMIVSGGENVFPQEVEETLAEHADVAEVAVVGVDDEKFGQRLVAFVVPRAGAAPDPDALKAHVRDRLANYKVPRQIELVDELPRNPTGKILKRDLADGLTADSG